MFPKTEPNNTPHRMKDQAASTVSDEDFAKRAERWPKDTPDTKEAYFIRDIFDCKSTLVFSNNDYQNLIPNFSPLSPIPLPSRCRHRRQVDSKRRLGLLFRPQWSCRQHSHCCLRSRVIILIFFSSVRRGILGYYLGTVLRQRESKLQ